MAGLVLTGASYVRPVTPFCRPNSMRSLGSCCKLFRQAALVHRTNSAGFDATTRRAFALPRAALSRRSKEASRYVDIDGDGAVDNKVLTRGSIDAHHVETELQPTDISSHCRQRSWRRHSRTSTLASVEALSCNSAMQSLKNCELHPRSLSMQPLHQEQSRLTLAVSLQRMHTIWSFDT